MSRVSQKKQYTEKQNRCVYIILNPKTKEFFVGYTLNGKENLRCAFKAHRTENRRATKDMIDRAKEQDIHLCFFKLDELYCTKVEAYHAVIGWTKILVEQEYINADHGNIECYIEDIFGEAEKYYESKKGVDVTQLFACESCLSPCKPEKKEASKIGAQQVQIKFSVNEEEKLRVHMNARAADRSVSAFVKEMALDMCIIKFGPDKIIDNHIAEISALRNGIFQLIYTIEKTGDYFPADLETIRELMQKISESEKRFLQMIEVENTKERKILKSQVESTVNERLDELQNIKKKQSKVNN